MFGWNESTTGCPPLKEMPMKMKLRMSWLLRRCVLGLVSCLAAPAVACPQSSAGAGDWAPEKSAATTPPEPSNAEILAELQRMRARIQELEARLQARDSSASSSPGSGTLSAPAQ